MPDFTTGGPPTAYGAKLVKETTLGTLPAPGFPSLQSLAKAIEAARRTAEPMKSATDYLRRRIDATPAELLREYVQQVALNTVP